MKVFNGIPRKRIIRDALLACIWSLMRFEQTIKSVCKMYANCVRDFGKLLSMRFSKV